MKYKNYYKILELKNDRASLEEVRSSYRRLAKLYHPDINHGDAVAAEKFKDVNEAYQILGDNVSRKKYDRLHFAYAIKENLNFENVKGKINFDGINEVWGMFVGRDVEVKTTNLDKKLSKELSTDGDDIDSEISITLEEAFYGKEKKIGFKMASGEIKNVTVKIPVGIHEGEKIRVAGLGKPGINGGMAGNLFIKVHFLKHNRFKLSGNDFIIDLPLAPWEAALGCNVELTGIDSNLLITVPKGTQSGDKLRIANAGYYNVSGSRGDLFACVRVLVPKELTEKEKQLFIEFSKISSFSPRLF